MKNIIIKKQNPWDKNWRLLMFDIPEPQKVSREIFRNKLKKLGFLRFQKSVWLHPYPCEDEIDFITENFSIAPHIYLLSVKIDNDKSLRTHFNLY